MSCALLIKGAVDQLELQLEFKRTLTLNSLCTSPVLHHRKPQHRQQQQDSQWSDPRASQTEVQQQQRHSLSVGTSASSAPSSHGLSISGSEHGSCISQRTTHSRFTAKFPVPRLACKSVDMKAQSRMPKWPILRVLPSSVGSQIDQTDMSKMLHNEPANKNRKTYWKNEKWLLLLSVTCVSLTWDKETAGR